MHTHGKILLEGDCKYSARSAYSSSTDPANLLARSHLPVLTIGLQLRSSKGVPVIPEALLGRVFWIPRLSKQKVQIEFAGNVPITERSINPP